MASHNHRPHNRGYKYDKLHKSYRVDTGINSNRNHSLHKIIFFDYYMCMKSSNVIKQLRHFDQKHDYWLYSVHELALFSTGEQPQQFKNSVVV